jgi:Sporulation and spore germination/WD40-like Beta Propeller Repeat
VGSRPLRLLRPIAALVALGGLAACTAGVPPTGDVVSISPVTTSVPQEDADVLQDLSGPSSGQSEVEVATGYMRAMNSGDVSKIQRWVMTEDHAQVNRWSEKATTIRVYSVFEPGQPQDLEDGRRVVPVKVKLVGQLQNGRDWSPATGDDRLDLEMGNDDGDVRVANPRGLWMRDVNFARLYTPTELYLVADKSHPSPQLAPAPVFVRKGATDPEASQPGVRSALELLLAGPRGRYENLETAIPSGTALRSFRYAEDVATVNLSRRFAEAKGSGQLRVGQVVWTVNRLLPTASVRILVENRPVGTVGDERFRTDKTWRRRDMPLAAMLPQRSRQRQDDAVLFVRRGEIFTVTPEAGQPPQLMGLVAFGTKSAPTWSPDRRWMAFLAGTGNERRLWVTPARPGGRAFPAEELSGWLSPPTWSPDSKRIYVISRDETGARLLEVSRSTLSVTQRRLPPLPGGLQPSSITVSPDGASVLAVADRPDRKVLDAEPVPGGQLFLGQFGLRGVLQWSQRQLAPGLGRAFSPVWVDPVTVGFIAETDDKDDLGKLWTVRSDGWDPTAVLNDTGPPIGDIGNQLTVDPSGASFVVPARSGTGTSLWMVHRREKSVSYLTTPAPTSSDVDPSFASR